MGFRKYNQNFILARNSRLVEILFISKLNDHPVVEKKEKIDINVSTKFQKNPSTSG
jgi:hypothetical protein